MSLANLFKIFYKGNESYKATGFSDFFRSASSEEKRQVLTEAARKANQDQKRVFEEAQLELKTR